MLWALQKYIRQRKLSVAIYDKQLYNNLFTTYPEPN